MKILENTKLSVASAIFAPTTKVVEFILAFLCIVWGLWVFNPGENSFVPPMAYATLTSVMGETYWGLLVLVLGIVQLAFVLRSKSSRVLFWHRKVVLIIQFVVWVTICTCFYLTGPSTAVPVYGTIAAITALSMFRVGYNE